MNEEIKAQWVADLRSGEYEQGTGKLNMDGKLCCLGVLCEQAVKAGVITKRKSDLSEITYYDGNPDILTTKVLEWAGLPDGDNPGNPKVTVDGGSVSLAELNDGDAGWEPRSFSQIADLIEAQL